MRTAKECIDKAEIILNDIELNLATQPIRDLHMLAVLVQANIDLARYLREEEREARRIKAL